MGQNIKVPLEDIPLASNHYNGIRLSILREDLVFPEISGNKFRKLKYSVQQALEANCGPLLSFGGAYSNHIAALARAAKLSGMRSIGIIRGEELASQVLNSTLSYARAQGMDLHFVTREQYRDKEDPVFIEVLEQAHGPFYLIPEGGTSKLAVKGCEEIWQGIPDSFDMVCVPVGTGGTLAGLVAGCPKPDISIKGYSAVKGNFQTHLVQRFTNRSNFSITDTYCFGGYAKIDAELIRFINEFRRDYGVLLDPVYTAKMLYGILDEIRSGQIPENTRILALHTGGIQGIAGMNQRLKKKNLPLIETR